MKRLERYGEDHIGLSPPARGRGLKPNDRGFTLIELLSPPARGRGLKL